MFKLTVDDEINLYLVNDSFTGRYVELVEENEEYLAQWLAWPRVCKTQDDFKEFVKDSLHEYAEGKSMNCAVEYRGEIVGNASFNTIQHELKRVEIGYWIGKVYQGKGIISRVCHVLIDYAFKNLEMDKVQIAAAEGNRPSRAVCERLGMKLEGILTHQEKVGDRILNHAVYGIHRMEIQKSR
ncbi:MAG: GNAT family N-acetyltransferase [Gammaproteobacteria bacterium]|nr:GNAT family N-acetyltransferase [Gammaproteobacteria bacterium]